MKKYLYTILIITLPSLLKAQQIPLYAQYDHDPLLYNPAMAGVGDLTNVFLSHRNQWRNIPGAPQTTMLSVDGPLKNRKVGLGGSLYNYSMGFIKRQGLNAIYSYAIELSEKSNLRFGLGLGIASSQIDFSQVMVKDLDDPYVLSGEQRKTVLDGSAGFMYIYQRTQVGLSVFQLFGNKIEYLNNNSNSTFQLSRNYLLSVKQTFMFDKEDKYTFSPLVMVRVGGGSPALFEMNLIGGWKETVWLGINYRNNYSLGMNVRMKVHDVLSLGYAFNSLLNDLGTSIGASHEIMLGYSFNAGAKKNNDKKIEMLQQDLMSLSGRIKAFEDSIQKKNAAEVQSLKKDIESLNQEIADLKKSAADSTAALKLQIALLEEKVKTLVDLIGK